MSSASIDVDAYPIVDLAGQPSGDWFLFVIIKDPKLIADVPYLAKILSRFDRGPIRLVARAAKTPKRSVPLTSLKANGTEQGSAENVADLWTLEAEVIYRLEAHAVLNPGLFVDQSLNRERLSKKVSDFVRGAGVERAGSLLNLFSYTGSFGLAALRAGAFAVTSVDLSQRYLSWEKSNLEVNFNGSSQPQSKRICEDARVYLKRAARRGLKFEWIVLDPPTFSRPGSSREKVFRVERDLPEMAELAVSCLARGGSLFVATNDAAWNPRDFWRWASELAASSRLSLERGMFPPEFGPEYPLKSFWLSSV